ncbi:unnamed protein product [Darwinula stevensoni]|uniref:Phospholipase A2-like central domain-containing protein n=1 Tax=Darwinula stevensoni TaxID=69355 RepID=A0A7R8XBF4_9CRUS|nr:unnamed protein product [Darwinula stevensoni]CAG0892789.1 unnamed protein product [Darwinula stevensoni]
MDAAPDSPPVDPDAPRFRAKSGFNRQIRPCAILALRVPEYTGEDVIRALARAGTKPMVMEDDTNFDLLLDECERRMRRKSKPETDDISNRVTFPGTKWCGPGNTASEIHDLGSYARTDACCRTHDLCPLSLAAGEHSPVMNLTNDSPFTLSHCLCDVHFKACLDGVGSMSSETVGRLFFNIGEMSCFRLDHPVVRCLKPSGSKGKNCEQYLLDVTQPPRWQIFANPSF